MIVQYFQYCIEENIPYSFSLLLNHTTIIFNFHQLDVDGYFVINITIEIDFETVMLNLISTFRYPLFIKNFKLIMKIILQITIIFIINAIIIIETSN